MKIKKQSSIRLLPVTLLVVAVGLLMGSCKKEPNDGGKGGLRAVMVDFANAKQKAYIDPLHYSCFTTGESVRVNNQTKAITPLADANYRRCEIGAVTEADNYYAFYPVELLESSNMDLSSGFNIQDNPVRVTVPKEQQWELDNDGNQKIKNPMMSDETEEIGGITHLLFKNVCALWKVSVSTTKSFDAIKISVPGCVMSGTGDIVTSGSGGHFPKLVVDSDTSHSVTMKFNSVHQGTAWGDGFYFVVPELTVPADSYITVEFFKGSNPVKKFKLKNPTGSPMLFEANKIHTLANFTFDVGLFSVRDGKTVVFAPGNLQWSYSALGTTHSTASSGYNRGTWRFAEHQYDYIGQGNVNAIGTLDGQNHFNDTYLGYSGWIDLFPWGGSGLGTTRPYYYSGNFYCENNSLGDYDWGKYNTIYNPQTKVNDPFGTTWYTLSSSEWNYVFLVRGNDTWWRYSSVKVMSGSDVLFQGMILYPDTTLLKPLGINSTLKANDPNNEYTITKAEYDILESLGCAFLPRAGRMTHGYGSENNGNEIHDVGNLGFYWAGDADSGKGHWVYLNNGVGLTYYSISHFAGVGASTDNKFSVRLAHVVKDVSIP